MARPASTRIRARITGVVQGVFYRASTRDRARELGLVGWVRNRGDGSVELEAEGPGEHIRRLLEWCRQGPAGAQVDQVEVEPLDPIRAEDDFEVIR